MDGTRSVRYFDLCENCDYRDLPNALAEPRWYILDNSEFNFLSTKNWFRVSKLLLKICVV